jgi:hypothetical protein
MKLSAKQIQRAASQIGAEAVPENHPVVSELAQVYGDHTFFLDNDGLEIVETAEPETTGSQTATVVKLASWADRERTTLAPHDPEPTDTVVELGRDRMI